MINFYYRLKKVLDNKRRMILEEEIEVNKKIEEMALKGIKVEKSGGGGNLIEGGQQDEDVIF